MFCPRCSQEQISEATKFCSRCGFPLTLVAEVLAHGGFLPQLAELHKDKRIFSRRNGLIFSLFWFLIFVLILTPIFGTAGADSLAAFTAIIGTMGALTLIAASFLILKKPPKNIENFNQNLPPANAKNLYRTQHAALPPQHSQPVQTYVSPANSWKAPDTGDLMPSQSVTEGTTKLLKNEE